MKKEIDKKLEKIVMEKVISLETENSQLKSELAYTRAKLDVYERITTITNSKNALGFGPPIIKEGGNC